MDHLHHVTRTHVRIASAILTLIGAAYTWQAFRLPAGNPVGSGAGGTPIVIGVLWVLFGAYVTIRTPAVHLHDAEIGTWPDRAMLGRLVLVALMSAGFILLLPWLGTTLTAIIFMTLMARMCGAPWGKSLIASVLLALSLWVLFVQLLELSLPTGSIFSTLWGA